MWALETSLGVNHRGLLLYLPVSPRISSLTSMSHFLTCTMGIIVKARVVVKGNEKVCVCAAPTTVTALSAVDTIPDNLAEGLRALF